MSEMNLHRSHPFPVVEGSAIGIIPNPMSGRDIRRIISQASVFSNTEKASMVLRILRTVGTLGVERVLLSTDTFGIAALVQREIKRMSGARSTTHIRWPKVEFLTLERPTGTAADTTAYAETMAGQCSAAVVLLVALPQTRSILAPRSAAPVPLAGTQEPPVSHSSQLAFAVRSWLPAEALKAIFNGTSSTTSFAYS